VLVGIDVELVVSGTVVVSARLVEVDDWSVVIVVIGCVVLDNDVVVDSGSVVWGAHVLVEVVVLVVVEVVDVLLVAVVVETGMVVVATVVDVVAMVVGKIDVNVVSSGIITGGTS
jgi:hypothetical protein